MSPANDEAPGVTAEGFRGETRDERPDSAAADADRQEFERLRAQLAARRHHVLRTAPADGTARYVVVAHGGWHRELADLAALRAFAQQIGGAAWKG